MQDNSNRQQVMFNLIEQWQASNMSQKDFCHQHQLPVHVMQYWLKKYRRENSISGSFTQINVDASSNFAGSSTTPWMELTLMNGKILRLYQPVSPDWIARLMQQC